MHPEPSEMTTVSERGGFSNDECLLTGLLLMKHHLSSIGKSELYSQPGTDSGSRDVDSEDTG